MCHIRSTAVTPQPPTHNPDGLLDWGSSLTDNSKVDNSKVDNSREDLHQGLSLCPADQRLQSFIDDYFLDVDGPVTDFS